jgi:hypothetical protein
VTGILDDRGPDIKLGHAGTGIDPACMVAAERLSRVIANAAGNCQAESIADAFNGNPVKHLLEESSHNHLDRLGPRKSTAAGVKNQFLIDATAGAAVSAANIIGFDFQSGY